jgi:hypothetical protein
VKTDNDYENLEIKENDWNILSEFGITKDNLIYNSNLSLSGCTSLEQLPEGLEVKGDLYLIGCTSLKALPEGLEVKGDLYMIAELNIKGINLK